MNKLTALALAGSLSLFTLHAAHATSEAPGTPPAPPPQGGEPQAGDPPPPPPGGEHGMGGPGGMERFEKADTNHDGFLTKDEMLNMQKERLDKMFAESDTNHDGKLSKEELDAGFKTMRAKMQARYGDKHGGQPGQEMPPQ